MTTKQLANYGIKLNSWIHSGFKAILFNGDQKIYTEPSTVQYYFDSENDLLFARYTSGFPVPENKKAYGVEYYEYEDNKFVSILPGGVDDNIIGKYHCVYDITAITLIF